ncbi:ISL3 family transposase [Rhodopirellula sp. SWK7]|uniref:ISL3 family transposase n=1 Tax=Rhodopirellula sp. SWK7 TaxID=595460 RepID=UPI0039657D31
MPHSRYVWLKSQENLTENQRNLFDKIYTQQLETGKAWAYKEMFRDLWHHDDSSSATTYFKAWYKRVIHTNLTPMKTVARSIKERFANVVSYCTHRITNAVAEGMSTKIVSIKCRVGGFRNIENCKTAIFFYCGGLELYPRKLRMAPVFRCLLWQRGTTASGRFLRTVSANHSDHGEFQQLLEPHRDLR